MTISGMRNTKPAAIRKRLFDMYLGICPYCGEPMTLDADDPNNDFAATTDHVIPKVSRGLGVGDRENKTIACNRCNQAKCGKSPIVYLARMHELRIPRWKQTFVEATNIERWKRQRRKALE